MLSRIIRKTFSTIVLPKNTNQAHDLAKYAIEFLRNGKPSEKALQKTRLFHTDSVICGVSALALKTNAPTILRNEALKEYKATDKATDKATEKNAYPPYPICQPGYGRVFGSMTDVKVEKALAANCSAVREWDSNGTVFGFNSNVPGHQAGEFGHNDFYPVVIAACQQNKNLNGKIALKAMLLLDEIRGRLAEVFSLKSYKIDHVVHGAIASAIVYGALLGATPLEIEHAVGMYVAHYIPFRAIRAGKQLSDSKGSSAAISTEAAILCMKRAMSGFIGPKDIFRNPEAIFRLNEPTKNGDSPFNLVMSMEGDDFATVGMHFKLGLYEHQSAGALEGLQKLLFENKFVEYRNTENIDKIKIIAYQPAFGIIGDPAKRNPTTRQSADHSMLYIVNTMLRKAIEMPGFSEEKFQNLDDVWKTLMLEPVDYSSYSIFHPTTRKLMEKTSFEHGGKEYDDKYPDGIPTSIQITLKNGKTLDSKLIMYPAGHARNTQANLESILQYKFRLLGKIAIKYDEDLRKFIDNLNNIENLTNYDLLKIYDCDIDFVNSSIDDVVYDPLQQSRN